MARAPTRVKDEHQALQQVLIRENGRVRQTGTQKFAWYTKHSTVINTTPSYPSLFVTLYTCHILVLDAS